MVNKWRHVVIISHLDPELHKWGKDEAARRSQDGSPVHFWQVIEEAVRDYREKCEAKEVAHAD